MGKRENAVTRFWRYVDKNGPLIFDTPCWLWTASVGREGYGRFGVAAGDIALAHRFAYLLEFGPIPEDFVVDHLCNQRRCVNVDHLRLTTRADNVMRGRVRITHCKHGHELTEANTLTRIGRSGNVHRWCRTCQYETNQRWRRRQAS